MYLIREAPPTKITRILKLPKLESECITFMCRFSNLIVFIFESFICFIVFAIMCAFLYVSYAAVGYCSFAASHYNG